MNIKFMPFWAFLAVCAVSMIDASCPRFVRATTTAAQRVSRRSAMPIRRFTTQPTEDSSISIAVKTADSLDTPIEPRIEWLENLKQKNLNLFKREIDEMFEAAKKELREHHERHMQQIEKNLEKMNLK